MSLFNYHNFLESKQMEATTFVGAGLAAYASKDVITKLLGPTADYLGDELAGLVDKCNINLGDIFKKSARKAGEKIDDGSQVNPRVLKDVINEGKFCDDDTLKEYYAGILASSRTITGDDDIGVSILSVLRSLSVYHVRLHYLFYSQYLVHYKKMGYVPLADGKSRIKRKLYIPQSTLSEALQPPENMDLEYIASHALLGLARNNLITNDWQLSHLDGIKANFDKATEAGAILTPTLPGLELFIWANGTEKLPPFDFLKLSIDPHTKFAIKPGSLPTYVGPK